MDAPVRSPWLWTLVLGIGGALPLVGAMHVFGVVGNSEVSPPVRVHQVFPPRISTTDFEFGLFASFLVEQLVGSVFLLASLSKLLDQSDAVESVERYGLLPTRFAHLLGRFLPWLELAIAFSLLTGVSGRCGAITAIAMLVAFSVAQTLVLLRGQEVPCGCFGTVSSRSVGSGNVLTNLVLVVCSVLALRLFDGWLTFQWIGDAVVSEANASMSSGDLLFIQVAVAAALIQFQSLRQVFDNRGYQRDYVRYQRELSAALAIKSALERRALP
ncbi:MAG: hypothetical protein HY000_34290 [Planctomycetes bacterium]|nr:hypothetical protein [Planctomycetota bacterium]